MKKLSKQQLYESSINSFRENFLELCMRLLTKNFKEDYEFLYDELGISEIYSKERFDDMIYWMVDDIGDVNWFGAEVDTGDRTLGYRGYHMDIWKDLNPPFSERREFAEWYNRADRYRMDGVVESMVHDSKRFRDVLYTDDWLERNQINLNGYSCTDHALKLLGHYHGKKIDVDLRKKYTHD